MDDQVPPGDPESEPRSEPQGEPDRADPAPGDPESAYELLQRGQALLARRHHAQAAVVLARAAALEPGRGSILEPLGRACFMSGQLDRAVETFEALLAVDPSSHYGHYALGRALIRLGRVSEGRTHLRLAVALAPDSRLYRGALDRLGDRSA
jgi:Flp pilus assembly protein TadD